MNTPKTFTDNEGSVWTEHSEDNDMLESVAPLGYTLIMSKKLVERVFGPLTETKEAP